MVGRTYPRPRPKVIPTEMRWDKEARSWATDQSGMIRVMISRAMVRHSFVRKKSYSWMQVLGVVRSQKPRTGLQLRMPTRIWRSLSEVENG